MTEWKDFTLAFPHNRETDEICLGLKQRKIGAGRYNGFGGEVEPHQTIGDATIAELQEESGLAATVLEYAAVIHFSFPGKTEGFRIHVSMVPAYEGAVRTTPEMTPQWIKREMLLSPESPFYERMLPADPCWLPLVMRGKKLIAFFEYNNNKEFIIQDKRISVVDHLAPVYDRKAHKTLSSQLKE